VASEDLQTAEVAAIGNSIPPAADPDQGNGLVSFVPRTGLPSERPQLRGQYLLRMAL
jgi:hypothetical protein